MCAYQLIHCWGHLFFYFGFEYHHRNVLHVMETSCSYSWYRHKVPGCLGGGFLGQVSSACDACLSRRLCWWRWWTVSEAERELWREGEVGGGRQSLPRWGGRCPAELQQARVFTAGTRLADGLRARGIGMGSAEWVSCGTNRKLKCFMRSEISECGD